MKKVLVSTVLAVTTIITSAAIVKPFHHDVYVHTGIGASAARNLIQDIKSKGMFEKVNLILESNGGSVRQEQVMTHALKGKYDSEIISFAASAAAMLFIGGANRTMAEHSEILFHEVRIQIMPDVHITLTDLAYVLSRRFNINHVFNDSLEDFLVKVKKMSLAMGNEYTRETFTKDLLRFLLSKAPMNRLQELLKNMTDTHLKDIGIIAKQTGMSEQEVMKKVMVPNVDVILTAKEALKLGIATEIKE